MQSIDKLGRVLFAVAVAVDMHDLHSAVLCKLEGRAGSFLYLTPDDAYGVEAECFTCSGSCIDMV